MKAQLSLNIYAGCPNCGSEKEFLLHELIWTNGCFTGWSCKNCHHVYDGKRVGDDWELTHKGVNTPTFVLLKMPPQAKPVYFIVPFFKGNDFGAPVGSQEAEAHNRFVFEENSVLTNHIQCAGIINWNGREYDLSNMDLIQYVAEVAADQVALEGNGNDDSALLVAFAPHSEDLQKTAESLGLLD